MILISTYPCPVGFKNIEIDLRNVNELDRTIENDTGFSCILFTMASKMLIVWRYMDEKVRDEHYTQIKKLMRKMPAQAKKCAWCGSVNKPDAEKCFDCGNKLTKK